MSNDNWSVDALFDGNAKPATGMGFQEPDEGAYKVQVTAVALVDGKKDPNMKRIVMDLTIVGEGPCVGMMIKHGLNVPSAAMSDKGREVATAFLKGALVGLGADSSKVTAAAGNTKLGPSAFMGKIGFVFYTPRPDRDSWSECRFIDLATFTDFRSGKRAAPARKEGGSKGASSSSASTSGANPFDAGNAFDAPPANGAPAPFAGGSAVADFFS